MVAALAGFLLLAAPDADAAKKALRIAYASLYEWREDKIANATFDFKISYHRKGLKPAEERKWNADGNVVFVDGEIKRIHIEGKNRGRTQEVRGELLWVLSRFARKPFEERYKEAKFKGPVDRTGGRKAVSLGRWSWLIKDDRFVAYEQDVGTKEKPYNILIELHAADVGEGYAILGESASHKRGKFQVSWSKNLEVGQAGDRVPVPQKYVHSRKMGSVTSTYTIEFTNPRLNEKHPIVLAPGVRDQVKEAWERRYRIPTGVRIDGEWNRDPGKATVKAAGRARRTASSSGFAASSRFWSRRSSS